MFHALRLAISDALQDGVLAAEAATTGISEAVAAGRNVPGLDDMAATAYSAILGTSANNPAIFRMARRATTTGPWVLSLEGIYANAIKSLAGTSDKLAHAASRKAATDAFFEAFGQNAVGVTRSVRYGGDRIRPSAHFIKMYRVAHRGMKDAARYARGPDRMSGKLAAGRLDQICSGAVMRAAGESWDSIRLCAATLAILERIILEDAEGSVTDAAGRAANIITQAVSGDPKSIMVDTILGDVIPKITYYKSRKRAHDAAVREIHKFCTDVITDAVGMCVVEALYKTFVAGAYRTAADKTFFRSNCRNALESACAFDPQKDIAGFEQNRSLPAHTVTRWWMGNALRYLVDIDYVAAANLPDNAAVMAFYEASYEAAHESASQESADLKAGGHT